VQPVSAAFPARRSPATAEQSTSVAASVTIRAALRAATLATCTATDDQRPVYFDHRGGRFDRRNHTALRSIVLATLQSLRNLRRQSKCRQQRNGESSYSELYGEPLLTDCPSPGK